MSLKNTKNKNKNIDNYIFFFKELDDNVVNTNTLINNLDDTLENDIDKLKNINILIDNINETFINNKFNTRQFSGWDVLNGPIVKMDDFADPNNYSHDYQRNKNKIVYYLRNIEKEKEKEKIFINNDVNNIADLIQIIDLYPLDDSKEYNINIDMLHKIKNPLIDLNNMIGMKQLKNNILDQILFYIQNLQSTVNSSSNQDFMHTVIYGSPGTGKTEIAKLIGAIFANLGILEKGTFRKVTRSDLIAGYLGQTAIKTRDVIKEALGGVLFIDEAYALGNHEKRDSFSKECIDTLCEAASDHKNNLMIIIAGYESELNECFFNYNSGLNSRFTWRFKTDQYNSEDLYKIFLKKVDNAGWKLSPDFKLNKEWFERNKDYFQFYGRDIETVLAKTKIAHARRIFGKPETERKLITLIDLDKGFEMFISNEEVKKRRESININRTVSNMYI